MSLFLGVVCFAIAIAAIVVMLQAARPSRQKIQPRYRDKVRTPQLLAAMARLGITTEKKPKKSGRKEPDPYKGNPKYRQLLVMLNGDRETADRLISAYGIDRAISDLERDRRIY